MANETEQRQNEFSIQRIYVKDLSVELPRSPEIFKEEWKPELKLDLHIEHSNLEAISEKDYYEVRLVIRVTVSLPGERTAFLIELTEAGIFRIAGWKDEELDRVLKIFCPNLLFPYAREMISECTVRASFPPLYITPISFEALYEEGRRRQREREKVENKE